MIRLVIGQKIMMEASKLQSFEGFLQQTGFFSGFIPEQDSTALLEVCTDDVALYLSIENLIDT